jgi:hypothetical protein
MRYWTYARNGRKHPLNFRVEFVSASIKTEEQSGKNWQARCPQSPRPTLRDPTNGETVLVRQQGAPPCVQLRLPAEPSVGCLADPASLLLPGAQTRIADS